MTATNDGILKADRRGRLSYSPEQRSSMVDAFQASGLSGPRFAALHGVKYRASRKTLSFPKPFQWAIRPSSDDRRPHSPRHNSRPGAFLPSGSRPNTRRRRFPPGIRPNFTINPSKAAETGKSSQLNDIQKVAAKSNRREIGPCA